MNEKIAMYLELLIQENQVQNLISRQSSKEDLSLHVEDSLKILYFLDLKAKQVLDMGSGQGLPSLPLALMVPELSIVLVESNKKKGAFLNMIVEALLVNNVQVVNERVEDLGHSRKHRGHYDYVTCRGLADLQVLLEWGLPLLKISGVLVAWKGLNVDYELERSRAALELLGGVVQSVEKYDLAGKERALVLIEKRGETPEKYPRRGGVAKKRPL